MADSVSSTATGIQEAEEKITAAATVQTESIRDGSGSVDDEKKAFLRSFTEAEDKAIMRKVDMRFLWLIGLMYLVKNIDYTNASNVKVLQVDQPTNIMVQLNMTADQYNWVQSIYFISYIIFEVPSNLLLRYSTPRLWQTRIMFTWGVVLACHAACTNKEGLYAARFMLGMMEAGMFPGIAAQLCSWYRSDEMGNPIMWMFGCQFTSGIFGSLLAYGISYLNEKGGMSAWQWVYLIEGLLTIVLSGIIFIVLPDFPMSPRSSKWLTPREQRYLEARLSENAPATHAPLFKRSEVVASLRDWRTYSFMAMQMLVNIPGYGLSWYLPTITTNLGFASLPRNQLLNIPPAAASVLAAIFAGWFQKKAYLTRPAFMAPIVLGIIVSFILLLTLTSPIGIYIACVLATMFYSVFFIPFWPWRSSTLSGATGTNFTLALQSCIGQVGGVIGPQIFQSQFVYNGYKTPFAICVGASMLAGVATAWTWWLTRNVEYDVTRVRRLRIEAEREGRVWAEDDVRVFEERRFYDGVGKRGEGIV